MVESDILLLRECTSLVLLAHCFEDCVEVAHRLMVLLKSVLGFGPDEQRLDCLLLNQVKLGQHVLVFLQFVVAFA